MSIAHIYTVAFQGIDAREVDVQVHIGDSGGNGHFNIVGLADKAVGESRERVRAALAAIGLALPYKRITVNLAPADLPKEGSHYDLPIALGLLIASGQLCAQQRAFECYGELGLADDLALEGALVAGVHTARVDERELISAPLHDHPLTIARDAGLRVHHGLARRREAVDERRLAGVRLAHDRDRAEQRALGLRFRLGRALPRAARARSFVAHESPRASTAARSRGRPAAIAACVLR